MKDFAQSFFGLDENRSFFAALVSVVLAQKRLVRHRGSQLCDPQDQSSYCFSLFRGRNPLKVSVNFKI
jgi:hypothetical protein